MWTLSRACPAHAVVANELKYKAPQAHTMLELVYVRWGRTAHIIYFFFAVLTNLLVSLSMLQGGHPSVLPQRHRCSTQAVSCSPASVLVSIAICVARAVFLQALQEIWKFEPGLQAVQEDMHDFA